MRTTTSGLPAACGRKAGSSLIVLFNFFLPYPCLLLLLIFAAGCFSPVLAQDIVIRNPSLEGVPRPAANPPYWTQCGITPDIQPGCCSVTLPPSDGKTYVGMQTSANWSESITQRLPGGLIAGRSYVISFDLAYPPKYYSADICNGSLAIYGGNDTCDRAEELWRSPVFTHTNWKRYIATFRPTKNYKYITLSPYFTPCKNGHISAVLIDNLSSMVKESPQIRLSALPTCPGAATGQVRAEVLHGTAPFTYLWKPGNDTTPQISNLREGVYEVVVVSANGMSVRNKIEVKASDLRSRVTVTPSRCYGYNESQIAVTTSGGTPPYRYYLNNNGNPSYGNVFGRLSSGNYAVTVRDELDCFNAFDSINVTEPPPLELLRVIAVPTSCSDVTNGQIVPKVRGGTPPYEYRIENGPWQSDSMLHSLKPGYYRFEVRDRQQCYVTGAATIQDPWPRCAVIMPNVFSPNSDGNNDVFRPKVFDDVRNYELSIYNRWGSLVFRSKDIKRGWDGVFRGSSQLAQTFMYICTYTNSRGQQQEMRGTVLLVY